MAACGTVCLSVRGLPVYCETQRELSPCSEGDRPVCWRQAITSHAGAKGTNEKMLDGEKCNNKYPLPVKCRLIAFLFWNRSRE